MTGTALITGITGQDGSYLAERLVRDGWQVHGTVNRSAGETVAPAGAIAHPLDLSEPHAVAALVRELRPQRVFALAAISSVAESWRQPVEVGLVNAMSTMALLDACAGLGDDAPRVVHAASAEIFGDAREVPQNEATPIAPVNPYGASKAYAYAAVRMFRARGLHASNGILYNHESPRRPEQFVSRKITSSVARIALGVQTVLELGNLDASRDFGWAPDTVDALLKMSAHDVAGDYVVATGETHTIRDFAKTAFAAVGIEQWESHIRVNSAFYRPVDPSVQLGDASKAHAVLGWQPSVSFEQMVRAMVEHDLHVEAERKTDLP